MTKNYVRPHFDHLSVRNVMVALVMLLASRDTVTNINGIEWAKDHAAPHLKCLDLRNAVAPCLMLLTSCNANTSASGIICPKSHVSPHFHQLGLIFNSFGIMWCQYWWQYITWPKRSCGTSFWSSWAKNCSCAIDNGISSHDANASIKYIIWQKKSCCTSFRLSWLSKYSDASNNANGFTWCWSWC